MHYVGRSDDAHRTINIKLEGLPYRGEHGVNAVPYTGLMYVSLQRFPLHITAAPVLPPNLDISASQFFFSKVQTSNDTPKN